LAVSCREIDAQEATDDDDVTFDAGPDPDIYDGGPDASENDGGNRFLCSDGSPELFINRFNPYYGGEVSVDLEVVVFAYFRCPHCANFAELADGLWQRREDFRDRVRLYFHHFPFSGQTALMMHAATHAAHEQGMGYFWNMHDLIYQGMNAEPAVYYTPEELASHAQNVLQLDMPRFMTIMESDQTEAYLMWDKQQAKDQGVSGTPSVFICGKKIPSWRNLESSIDEYLLD
jgi:protein-disulfide isomerase